MHWPLKPLFLLGIVALLLSAQTAPKFESCGLGSHHECNCVRRVQAIHQKTYEDCAKQAGAPEGREFDACVRANLQSHGTDVHHGVQAA